MVYYAISGTRFSCPPSSLIHKSQLTALRGSDCRTNASSSLSFFLPFSRKIFAGKSASFDSDSSSNITVTTASKKVLVPGDGEIESSSSTPTDQSQLTDTVTAEEDEGESQVLNDVNMLIMGNDENIEDEIGHVKFSLPETVSIKESEPKPRRIPPPGRGQKIYEIDPSLTGFSQHLDYRYSQYKRLREEIDKYEGGLEAFSRGYEKFGFTRSETGITYREWAPGATSAALIGDFNNWNPNADVMTRNEFGVWEIFLPNNVDGSPAVPHGSRVKVTFLKDDSGTLPV